MARETILVFLKRYAKQSLAGMRLLLPNPCTVLAVRDGKG